MPRSNKYTLAQAVRQAYARGQEDETLLPLVLTDKKGTPLGRLITGDCVIFYNIRGEREIELTRSLTEDNFDKFSTGKKLSLNFATMIEYHKNLNVQVAYPPENVINDTLSDIIAQHQLKQVKITEAEKAIHLGYFFSGKKNKPVAREERIVVPTRKDVVLFDEAPQMSINEITRAALNKISDDTTDFIVVNFPNVDVVGHIENESAVIEAVEAVDKHIGILVERAREKQIPVIVTADHGTVEKWHYPDGAVDTGHTNSPVPFILVHPERNIALRNKGLLIDVAPSILNILGLPVSPLMTGKSLIRGKIVSKTNRRRLLLIIADGWGYNENKTGNLIFQAKTPVMDELMNLYPISILKSSGEAVGLPPGTVGNSEAGHLHIGAGRVILSDRRKIDEGINDRSFYSNPVFLDIMKKARTRNRPLHLMGIVSFFSSHGSINHLFALMDMAKQEGVAQLFVHAMLGRRGEMPESGARYIQKIEQKANNIKVGKVVSVIGRYWSMDREENWDRIEKTYRMLVYGEGEKIAE